MMKMDTIRDGNIVSQMTFSVKDIANGEYFCRQNFKKLLEMRDATLVEMKTVVMKGEEVSEVKVSEGF